MASIIYILIRYRFKTHSKYLNLNKETVKRLIKKYTPSPLVEDFQAENFVTEEIKFNFSSYDIFNLGNMYKKDSAIHKYGIGICGPRGFYGTLDIHLQLEDEICKLFNKESLILYSNHFMAIQSIITSFYRPKNTIFHHIDCSEAICRGLKLSKSKCRSFIDLNDLELKLKDKIPDRFVIVERLGKNNGILCDSKQLTELRRKYGFK